MDTIHDGIEIPRGTVLTKGQDLEVNYHIDLESETPVEEVVTATLEYVSDTLRKQVIEYR